MTTPPPSDCHPAQSQSSTDINATNLERLSQAGVEVVRYADLAGVPCPCGSAKRGFMESPAVPFSLHVTEISATARVHYHKRLTETYFILQCKPGAYLELNGNKLAIEPQMAVLIPPGTRHRAVGEIQVAIVAWPKFDPEDEWFDD